MIPLFQISTAFFFVSCLFNLCRAITSTGTGPVFIVEPPRRINFPANNKNGIVIDCLVHGEPNPSITWQMQNGNTLKDGSRISGGYVNILPNNSLFYQAQQYSKDIIQQSELNQEPEIRCRASNKYGTILSRRVHLNTVIETQRYSTQVYDEYVITSNTALFTCHIPSYISDFVEVTAWIKDDQFRISSNAEDSRYAIGPNGELLISGVTENDANSIYKCETTHKISGHSERSKNGGRLHVTRPSSGMPPSIVKILPDLKVKDGNKILMLCVAHGHPPPQNRWCFRRNDTEKCVPISLADTRIIGGSLIFIASKEKSGIYSCTATNDMGAEQGVTRLTVFSKINVFIHPQNQMVDIGKSASLQCFVSGGPITSLHWMKDGETLQTKLAKNFKGVETFNISHAGLEVKGMYQCFAENDFEMEQASAQLMLSAMPPKITKPFQGQAVNPGKSIRLKCSATGDPIPKIEWRRRGSTIFPSDRIKIDSNNNNDEAESIISISKIGINDGAIYSCFAQNKVGKDSFSEYVNVYGRPYVWPIGNLSVVAGSNATMHCYVSGFPIRNIQWNKGRNEVEFNGRIQMLSNGSIHILKVNSRDQGRYSCVAFDQQGLSSNAFGSLKVVEPPQLMPFLEQNIFVLGKNLHLTCTVRTGDPPIDFTWKLNGKSLPYDLELTVSDATYTSTLGSEMTTRKHSGNYSCEAKNLAGFSSVTTIVYIEGPPEWKDKPTSKILTPGKIIRVPCSGYGYPKPLVNWYKIQGRSKTKIKTLRSESIYRLLNGTLIVTEVYGASTANFSCIVSNGIGSDLVAQITLSPEINKIVFVNVQNNFEAKIGEKIDLKCKANGKGLLEVKWYKGSKALSLSSSRVKMKNKAVPEGIESSLEITNLFPKDAGLYKCQMHSPFVSNFSMIYLSVVGNRDLNKKSEDLVSIDDGKSKSDHSLNKNATESGSPFKLSGVTLLYIIPTVTAAIVLFIILILVCALLLCQRKRNFESKRNEEINDYKRNSTSTLTKRHDFDEHMTLSSDRYYQMKLDRGNIMEDSDNASFVSTYPRGSSQIQPYATFTSDQPRKYSCADGNASEMELKRLE